MSTFPIFSNKSILFWTFDCLKPTFTASGELLNFCSNRFRSPLPNDSYCFTHFQKSSSCRAVSDQLDINLFCEGDLLTARFFLTILESNSYLISCMTYCYKAFLSNSRLLRISLILLFWSYLKESLVLEASVSILSLEIMQIRTRAFLNVDMLISCARVS